jgi:hypothetical protein
MIDIVGMLNYSYQFKYRGKQPNSLITNKIQENNRPFSAQIRKKSQNYLRNILKDY